MINVVLADDHQVIRQGLRHLLESDGGIAVVGEAPDGLSVQEVVAARQPDVVLMDLNLPVTDGIAATRELVRRWPKLGVVVLTIHRDEGHLFQALRAGARGYLSKERNADDVIAAVRTVAAGGSYIEPLLATRVLAEFRRLSAIAGVQDGFGRLTENELKLLRLVAAGLSNREIADRLCFAESTVKNRLSILFDKIGVSDRTQAAVYALNHGLVAPT